MQLVDAPRQFRVGDTESCRTHLVDKPLEFPATERNPEELHRQIRHLVRLVENHRLGSRQEFDKPLFFHREIG